jgi:RES domain-containing protein
MLLWRLSGVAHARALDGGYGLHFDGRWNTVGHAVTYCATSPSLCVLEKLVHVDDPALLPALMMVRYDLPADLTIEDVELGGLPQGWRKNEALTQDLGDRWHEAMSTALLRIPSAIVPIAGSPDLNFVINHRHPDAERIGVLQVESFVLDARLT